MLNPRPDQALPEEPRPQDHEPRRPERSARELLDRCAAGGSESDWREFERRFEPSMRQAIRRILLRAMGHVSRDIEDDLMQEAYCRLLADGRRRMHKCERSDDAGVVGFLCRLAENVSRDVGRKERAAKRGRDRTIYGSGAELGVLASYPDPRAEPDRRMMVAEGARIYFEHGERALNGLTPRRDLEVTFLAEFGGWTSREIAERLSLTTTNVDSIVHRTRQRLAAADLALRPAS